MLCEGSVLLNKHRAHSFPGGLLLRCQLEELKEMIVKRTDSFHERLAGFQKPLTAGGKTINRGKYGEPSRRRAQRRRLSSLTAGRNQMPVWITSDKLETESRQYCRMQAPAPQRHLTPIKINES